MTPPISIDGTDITGATIDGTEVQEITVDGQTVFSAGPNFPVAYSNLVAWYPFDSATYGGSNADDVTGILAGSADDTAYDGTVNGATYQSSGGVNDINAGANSGAFDFDGNDVITTSLDFDDDLVGSGSSFTAMGWGKPDTDSTTQRIAGCQENGSHFFHFRFLNDGNISAFLNGSAGSRNLDGPSYNANEWYHIAVTYDGSTYRLFVDGTLETSGSISTTFTSGGNVRIGDDNNESMNGTIDDVRFYNSSLSSAQVSDIVANTPHP